MRISLCRKLPLLSYAFDVTNDRCFYRLIQSFGGNDGHAKYSTLQER